VRSATGSVLIAVWESASEDIFTNFARCPGLDQDQIQSV